MIRPWEARERLLSAALRVLDGRIDNSPPGPHDDAEAEYAEEELNKAAAELTRGHMQERLGKQADPDGPSSALETRLVTFFEQHFDDANAHAGLPPEMRNAVAEIAVMELALIEITKLQGQQGSEAVEIALEALPEGAGGGD